MPWSSIVLLLFADRIDLSYFLFPSSPDERKKWEVFCKRADKKFKILVCPTICSLHFKEYDIEISISGIKSVRSGCYPTIFDPTKSKKTKSPRAERLENRKRRRRSAEQPQANKCCYRKLNFKDATENYVHVIASMTAVSHNHSYLCSQEQATPKNNMNCFHAGLSKGKCSTASQTDLTSDEIEYLVSELEDCRRKYKILSEKLENKKMFEFLFLEGTSAAKATFGAKNIGDSSHPLLQPCPY